MSLKELRKKGESALDMIPQRSEGSSAGQRRPVTAPGATAMMQPTIDSLNERAKRAEGRAAELEARIRDTASSETRLVDIEANPWQPRRVFDNKAIERLAESIAEIGLVQPIVVRRNPRAAGRDVQPLDSKGTGGVTVQPLDMGRPFQIIVGERRYRAHELLNLETIKAVIVEATDSDMAVWSLSENIDREDLTDFEIARAIQRAEAEFPNRTQMARALGFQRSDLYRFLDFFKLPEFVVAELDVKPELLSRRSASELQRALSTGGVNALDALNKIWGKVKSGEVDPVRLSELIALGTTKDPRLPTERDIRKLFVGKEQAGSITRDPASLTVKIRAAALTPEMEAGLRAFVEQMLASSGP